MAEALRTNTVTPRGKMSLLHLAEQGVPEMLTTGGPEKTLDYLSQCTGCGRCTEYCVHEIDVAEELRVARGQWGETLGKLVETRWAPKFHEVSANSGSDCVLLICEIGREDWWLERPQLLSKLNVNRICSGDMNSKEWLAGKTQDGFADQIVEVLEGFDKILVESPEHAWVLANVFEATGRPLEGLKILWNEMYSDFCGLELRPEEVFHDSFFFSRLLPRKGVSVATYERGILPFHNGWNALDSGTEGHYPLDFPDRASLIAKNFVADLKGDGRKVDYVICQGLDAAVGLARSTGVETRYWLEMLA